MGDVVSTYFRLMVPDRKLQACILSLEEGLRCLKRTPFHRVLGKTFLHQTNELSAWLIDFSQNALAGGVKLAAIYVEMNGFTINPHQWHCDIFGYKKAGDIWDLDWLSAWDFEREDCFVLRGMESLQETYAELFLDQKQPLGVRLAEEIAEHLVTARFMEVVAAAHKAAKRRCPALRRLPVLATAHDWDAVHQTQ